MATEILTGLSMFMIFLISSCFWLGMKGFRYITDSEILQEFIRFLSFNLGLLLILPALSVYSTVTTGLSYHFVIETMYIISSYIILAILLVNLILGLWSFIPLYAKMLAKWVSNK